MRNSLAASAAALVLFPALACAADLPPLNPDTDPSRVSWSELSTKLGPIPDTKSQSYGAVLKTLTNEYWRLLA